jgi:N6-L-threonylcarbamoyladenine synthase
MAAAVVRDGRVLSSVVHGQGELHRPYGGVVPELASRDHVRSVSRVVTEALEQAGVAASELAGIAVTAGPGLVGSLLVGVSFAKALAYRLGIPLVGVHHLTGHLASAELASPELAPPYLGLVISGGHTALYRIAEEEDPSAPASGAPAPRAASRRRAKVIVLGETRDDAVGEAFDKVAKLLGLPYPGGPAVSAAAAGGDAAAFDFPRPLAESPGLDFSFSGLKTAVALEVERQRAQAALAPQRVSDLAASFEQAAVDVLVARARRALAAEPSGTRRLAVVGGVAANRRLRAAFAAAGREDGFQVIFPPPSLCTDNAAMIAAAGARQLAGGARHGLSLESFSRIPIGASLGRAPAPA